MAIQILQTKVSANTNLEHNTGFDREFNPLGPLINFSRGQGCLNYFRVAVESFAFGV